MSEPAKKSSLNMALAVAVVALLVALGGLGATLVLPQGRTPQTQNITLIIGEGEIIQEVNGSEELTGEYHRWEPDVIVVNKGDTVQLTVRNPRSNIHSFVLTAFAVDSGPINGRTLSPPNGGEWTGSFVADEAGVFQFRCGIPFDEATGECDPDHARIVGYLIVLD